MELIYKGKTKDVYKQETATTSSNSRMTTGANGFDPGANAVGAKIEGNGRNCLRLTKYFRGIGAKGIKTHYVASDLDTATMTVKFLASLSEKDLKSYLDTRQSDPSSVATAIIALSDETFQDSLK